MKRKKRTKEHIPSSTTLSCNVFQKWNFFSEGSKQSKQTKGVRSDSRKLFPKISRFLELAKENNKTIFLVRIRSVK